MQQAAYRGQVLVARGIASLQALHLSSYTPQRPKDKPKQTEQLREPGLFCATWHPLYTGVQQWLSPPNLIQRENLPVMSHTVIFNNSFSNFNLWALENTWQKDYRRNVTFPRGLTLDSVVQRDQPYLSQCPPMAYCQTSTILNPLALMYQIKNHTLCTFSDKHVDSLRGFNHAKQRCFQIQLRKDRNKAKTDEPLS